MTESKQELVCRRCEVRPQVVKEEGRGDVVRCPRCDVFGDKDEVIRLAREYSARSVMHSHIRDYQRGQVAATKGLKNVSYSPGKLPALTPPDFIFK